MPDEQDAINGRSKSSSKTAILREAKPIAEKLRHALKEGHEPSDPEIESLRRSLRDHYLSFLFAGRSLSARAGDVVNLMWLECSHALIKRHRDRIARIDAELDRSAHMSRKQRTQAYKGSNEGTGARRKLVHALRAFLTQEEGFWASLIGRIIETFHVERARPAAAFLKLYVMPERDSSATAHISEGEHALALVQTALVFYGDLARYSELYRDAANKERRFERAAECYHQARLLMPWSGQPDHQLAVIASGRKDQLAAAFHYMRALAVRSSFSTARPNLETTYKQAISQYKSMKDVDEVELGDVGAECTKTFIALLAFLVSDTRPSLSNEEFDLLSARFERQLTSALETRALSSENIIKTLLLAIATWWDARLRNDASAPAGKGNEDMLLSTLLSIMIAMFTVSANMTEASFEVSATAASITDSTNALGARISAPVRRIAPALRIASLWMLGNLEQIGRADKKDAFWTAYHRLVETLTSAYPPESLPALPSGCNLEEDFELLSFLPCPLPPGNAASPYVADHPNSEFLFRIQGFLSDASLTSLPPTQRPISSETSTEPSLDIEAADELANEDDANLLAEAMDAARLSSAYQSNEADEDEDEVLYDPHAARRVPSPFMPPAAPLPLPGTHAPTAQDLLSTLLRGETALPPQPNIWGSSSAGSQLWGLPNVDSTWQQQPLPPPAASHPWQTWHGAHPGG